MTSYLIDINVWLGLSWGLHPSSAAACAWLAGLGRGDARLLFCRVTQLGLLRLLTNEQVMGGSVLTVAEAFAAFDRWQEDPRVELAAEPGGVESLFRLGAKEAAGKRATKAVMDAYLAGFAAAEGATLVTFDKALQKMAKRAGARSRLLSH
jgi:hypothetical protein